MSNLNCNDQGKSIDTHMVGVWNKKMQKDLRTPSVSSASLVSQGSSKCIILIARVRLGYSLVPKERHVWKESNGSTLGLCVVPKERHDSTLIKEVTPKESHDCSFSLT